MRFIDRLRGCRFVWCLLEGEFSERGVREIVFSVRCYIQNEILEQSEGW